jgi:hypothetical protein
MKRRDDLRPQTVAGTDMQDGVGILVLAVGAVLGVGSVLGYEYVFYGLHWLTACS